MIRKYLTSWFIWPLLLLVVSFILFALPGKYEGKVLLQISPGHALSILDLVALAPLLNGFGWILAGICMRREKIFNQIRERISLSISIIFVGGFGLGMLIASAFSLFFWWWLIGAGIFFFFLLFLIYLTL